MKLSGEQFVFVRYNGIDYPEGYISKINEVAAHFDKNEIETTESYSLHTEYSYGKRKLDSMLVSNFPILQEANKDGVPQLWKSEEWADSFADFVIALVKDKATPQIIEIHPPFNDYCTVNEFVERFRVFEKKIHSTYPNTSIFIENRAGTVYRGGRFLMGKAREIAVICDVIRKHELELGIVLDFPQLLTAEGIESTSFKSEKYLKAIETLTKYRDVICGIHIWGKKKSSSGRWVAHCGNFDTYFNGDNEVKNIFISGIQKICNDGLKRYFVPEVNSGTDDLASIMKDLFEN